MNTALGERRFLFFSVRPRKNKSLKHGIIEALQKAIDL